MFKDGVIDKITLAQFYVRQHVMLCAS